MWRGLVFVAGDFTLNNEVYHNTAVCSDFGVVCGCTCGAFSARRWDLEHLHGSTILTVVVERVAKLLLLLYYCYYCAKCLSAKGGVRSRRRFFDLFYVFLFLFYFFFFFVIQTRSPLFL